jgi:hypothetical protein
MILRTMSEVEAEFWSVMSSVPVRRDGCWIWPGGRCRGYGVLYLQSSSKPIYVARLSYEIHNGRIPAGKHVRLACQNRACCAPAHLRVKVNAAGPAVTHHRQRRRWHVPRTSRHRLEERIAQRKEHVE